MLLHPIDPVFDYRSEILILGSFPSVKSREAAFFYGHPQNRFWKVLAAVYADALPETTDEKRRFLLQHHIALWDVIASCEIEGSADSTIRNVQPSDLSCILKSAQIRRIFLNGRTAEKFYKKYQADRIALPVVCLPSTSPANAAWNLEKLIAAWQEIQK